MNDPPSIFTGLSREARPRRRSTASLEHRLAVADALSAPSTSLPQPVVPPVWLPPPPPPLPPPVGPAKPATDSPVPTSSSLGEKRSSQHRVRPRRWTQTEPLHKRRKLQSRSRDALDPSRLPAPSSFGHRQPPSPLFFSHTKRARPSLPTRFSSSEAAARMLTSACEEGAIKTVTLARGTCASSTSSTRNSIGRSSLPPASPDCGDRPEFPRTLSTVGAIELLELDTRPTFIVDVVDAANCGPGCLNIVYVNAALRASLGLLDLVSGKAVSDVLDSAAFKHFAHFKAWVLGVAVRAEPHGVFPLNMPYANLSWTACTLRKSYRVVSANHSASFPSSPAAQIPSPAPGRAHTRDWLSPEVAEGLLPVTLGIESDATDYFGPASKQPSHCPNNEQSHAPRTTTAQSLPIATEPGPNAPAGLSRLFKGASDAIPLTSHPSMTNECVLRAAVAGDVDSFQMISDPNENAANEIGFFDWTRLPIDSHLPKHIQFARSVDWASTPLGPIEFWSADLRQMCNLIMASPHPAAMYWGDDLVAIYNEAYILLAGQKHPALMGQSYRDAWTEIWDDVKDVFADAKTTGQATMKDDDCLFIKRSNYLEETYFSWAIIPMIGGDGTVMGLYNPAFEKTRRKIAERRMLTLREVGERTAIARDVKSFWDQVLQALASNEFDTPFVLLYSVIDDSDSDSSSMHSSSIFGSRQCLLEGSMGVPAGHRCAPEHLELKTSMEGFAPVLREVMKTDKPVLLRTGSGDLPDEMMHGIGGRGFADTVQSVVVCPIHPTTGESILGFLVLGVNPRRPYDDDYNLFVQLLSRQLATSLASVVLFEEEIRRGQRAAKLAALDRIELSEQLAARTQEARDSETRFTRMAEFSPAGLFIANSEGHVVYCNDTWYEISRVHKDTASTGRWIEAVNPEDQPLVARLWNTLVEKTEAVTAEFRFRTPWEDKNGNRSDTWVLFSAYPEKNDQGALKSVFGTITNISQQKWAEGFQKRKMEEAVELKRQQENFIDITSHEMRNPMSAILQCADWISSSLIDFHESGSKIIDDALVKHVIDYAQTIALCAQHQKRIVDDVLTLSKLDSALLLVTPVDVQPLAIVQLALRMFDGQLRTADMHMEFIVDESFTRSGVDWVRLDSSRVLQVLINLITNAIKFTTGAAERTIRITIAASTVRFSRMKDALVDYFPTRSKSADMTQDPDWGTGEEIYVQFAVQDTGRGLNEEEKKLLFMRFSQASPRTHVQYGGSGLGLFISRELTELQGGEIGVASQAGKGSTFAFYVKARRSDPPADPVVQPPVNAPRALADSRNSRAAVRGPVVKARDFAAASGEAQREQKQQQMRDRQATVVLIVEDNVVNQKVLQRQLTSHGFTVHVANHGAECLDWLRNSTHYRRPQQQPLLELSVVLMDQEMPVMDGLECTRTIRRLEQQGDLLRHVPIVAVTANARSEQIAQLMAAGMDDVVSKPFRIPELVPKIDELAARFKVKAEHGQ